jgi:hypothetical protein
LIKKINTLENKQLCVIDGIYSGEALWMQPVRGAIQIKAIFEQTHSEHTRSGKCVPSMMD